MVHLTNISQAKKCLNFFCKINFAYRYQIYIYAHKYIFDVDDENIITSAQFTINLDTDRYECMV